MFLAIAFHLDRVSPVAFFPWIFPKRKLRVHGLLAQTVFSSKKVCLEKIV